MSGPIFGNTSTLSSSGGNRHLVEFRAGRMNMMGKMVHPDTRKGLVYVYQAEDGLIHFCWKDRTTGNVEDDLIIFPDDCEFKKIDQCKTGRVYLLKFKSPSRKLFFWMQEPKTDKDDEWCRRVNEVMNNPPSVNNISSGGRNTDSSDLQYMLNNMSQQQLMQLFGGVGQMGGLSTLFGSTNRSSDNSSSRGTPASARNSGGTVTVTPGNLTSNPTTPQAPRKVTRRSAGGAESATPANNTSNNDQSRVLLNELQNYLSGLSPDQTNNGSSNSRKNVDFSTSLNSEALTPIISNPEYVENLEAHLPNIGTKENIKQQLKDTISSPQFQQALSMFSSALQSGQLGPVVSQFQLSPEAVAAANKGDLEQFVKALEKSAGKVSIDDSSKDSATDKDGRDDDEMTMG